MMWYNTTALWCAAVCCGVVRCTSLAAKAFAAAVLDILTAAAASTALDANELHECAEDEGDQRNHGTSCGPLHVNHRMQ